MAQVEQRFGPLDGLVNNAGIGAWKPLLEWSAQEVIGCVNLNLLAPMLLSRAVLPGMVTRRRGMIVNIANESLRRRRTAPHRLSARPTNNKAQPFGLGSAPDFLFNALGGFDGRPVLIEIRANVENVATWGVQHGKTEEGRAD